MSRDFLIDLGLRIRSARKRARLNQQQLAKQLGLKNDVTICRWENGKTAIDVNTLQKLCKILNVSADELLALPLSDEASKYKEIERIVKRGL